MNILMIVMGLFALLAVGAYLAGAFSGPREKCANAYSEQPHPCGKIGRVFTTAMTSPYLLAKLADDGTASICGTNDEPLGPCMDTPEVGERATVLHLGAVSGTLSVVTSSTTTIGERVYTFAGGQVTPNAAPGRWLVGRTLTAGGNGDVIEIAPLSPVQQ